MAFMIMSSVLAALFFANTVTSLQVSSNSPCASLCLDTPSQNSTSSTTSNTSVSDIVCVDADFGNTPAGEKYMSCVSCLATSTASDSNGSDQEWFLYNLRFALDTCLFGFANPSNAVSSPCSTSESCGPLQAALEDGNLLLSDENEFGYCSAENNAFLGTSLGKCQECLSNTSNERYLSNFLTVLHAGCVQQPTKGTTIGIEGSIFSATPVNVTYAGYNQTSTSTSTPTHKNGLPQAAIIGIAVGLAVLLMISIALIFVCSRRRLNRNRRMKELGSPLDSRFGAANITSPQNGAYGNPSVAINEPFDPALYTAKELSVLDKARTVLQKHNSTSPRDLKGPGWHDPRANLALKVTPPGVGATIPTHQAYIPSAYSPISPADSLATYQMAQYPPSRSSPKNVPPPLQLQQPKQLSPWEKSQQQQHNPNPSTQAVHHFQQAPPQTVYQPPQVFPSAAPVVEFRPLFGDEGPPVVEARPPSRTQGSNVSPEIRPPSRAQTASVPLPEYSPPSRVASRAESRQRNESRTRDRSQSRTRDRSQSRNRGIETESSRVYQPAPHSQQYPMIERAPSRSHSRNESWRRATRRAGFGNVNTSVEIPIQISGPIIKHGGRFDFDLAERERLENEQKEMSELKSDRRLKKEASPESAESPEEQWPGIY